MEQILLYRSGIISTHNDSFNAQWNFTKVIIVCDVATQLEYLSAAALLYLYIAYSFYIISYQF